MNKHVKQQTLTDQFSNTKACDRSYEVIYALVLLVRGTKKLFHFDVSEHIANISNKCLDNLKLCHFHVSTHTQDWFYFYVKQWAWKDSFAAV